MHSSVAQQLAYNGLYKLHRDSLCVLARIMKTAFRGCGVERHAGTAGKGCLTSLKNLLSNQRERGGVQATMTNLRDLFVEEVI